MIRRASGVSYEMVDSMRFLRRLLLDPLRFALLELVSVSY
jgi:hypothetical protein